MARQHIGELAERRVLVDVNLAMVVGQVGGAEIPVEAIGSGGIEGVDVRGRAEAAVVPADQPLQRAVAGRSKPQLFAELTGIVVLGVLSGADPKPRVARPLPVLENGPPAGGPKKPPM